MVHFLRSLILSGILLLSATCSTESPVPQAVSADNSGKQEVVEEGQPLYEGKGPLVIIPAPGEDGKIPSLPGEIDPSMAEPQGGSYGGEPGQINSSAPEELLDEEDQQDVTWLTYHDQAFSFSINYPNIYLTLPESTNSGDDDPANVHQVRFQDIQLATGDTADFEIPSFSIEVFDLGDHSLEGFIALNEPDGLMEAYQENRLSGFRVSHKRLIAPNEFYFFSANGYVYKLTPLGIFSQEMLHSFQIE